MSQVKTQFNNSFVTYLNLIECIFDRCIKPNWYQSLDRFDPDAVLAQVRSLAVVPTVQMRNLGFPYPASRVAFDLSRQIGKRKETLRATSRFPIEHAPTQM